MVCVLGAWCQGSRPYHPGGSLRRAGTQGGALPPEMWREPHSPAASLPSWPRCTEAQGCAQGWVAGRARRVAAAGRGSALSSGDPTLCIAIPECAGPEDLSGCPQPRMVPLMALCKVPWGLGVRSSQELICFHFAA